MLYMLYKIEPPCSQERKMYLAKKPILGRYIPVCDEDGYYKARQCHENYCWCVDRYNQVIEGSKKEAWLVKCRKFTSKFYLRYKTQRYFSTLRAAFNCCIFSKCV